MNIVLIQVGTLTHYCSKVLDPEAVKRRYSRIDPAEPKYCQRHAIYYVDGKTFCKQHTGELAVDCIMIGEYKERGLTK